MPRHRIHRSSRGSSGSTVQLPPRTRIIFQRYPGVAGDDCNRAIGSVPFVATYGCHRQPSHGTTNPDGSIEIYVWPSGETHLRMFDTDFQLIEADVSGGETEDMHNHLIMLGYVDAAVNAYAVPECEAISMFQEDRDIEPSGSLSTQTNRALRQTYGY